jgi:hypothetical protein
MTRNIRQTFHESHLYHGTPEEFAPGDVILPANQVGKPPSNRGDVAYATPDIHTGNFMAWEQNNHNGENFKDDSEGSAPKTNLYRVEPVDPSSTTRKRGVLSHSRRLFGAGRESDEVTSPKGFRVLSKVNDPAAIISKIQKINEEDPNKEGYPSNGAPRPAWESYGNRETFSPYKLEQSRKWKRELGTYRAQKKTRTTNFNSGRTQT